MVGAHQSIGASAARVTEEQCAGPVPPCFVAGERLEETVELFCGELRLVNRLAGVGWWAELGLACAGAPRSLSLGRDFDISSSEL